MDETTEQPQTQGMTAGDYIKSVLNNPDATWDEKSQAYGMLYNGANTAGLGFEDEAKAFGLDDDQIDQVQDWSLRWATDNWDSLNDDEKKAFTEKYTDATSSRSTTPAEVDEKYGIGSDGDNVRSDVFVDYHNDNLSDNNVATTISGYMSAAGQAINGNTDPLISALFGKSSSDIIDEYSDTVDSAKAQHDNAWQNQIDLLTDGTTRDDGSERTISSSLDQYDTTMDELNDTTTNQLDAQKNYNDYLNPYTQQQIDEANQAIAGASGAKLQSSATQNAIYQNTANMQGSAVNNATSDALTDASNTLSNVNTQSQVAGNLLTADATPEQDVLNANQDWANENLETAVNMANTIADTETGDNGILGNLNIVTNTLGNKNKS